MRRTVRFFALLRASALALCTAIVGGNAQAEQALTVSDAWARATVEGQTGSGVFLHLMSPQDAQLVGASSLAAQQVEIHEMRTVGGMMTMRRIERLALPAGKTVALDHDYHIMLIGLTRQLQPGQSLTLTLQWLDAAGARHETNVVAPVRALNTPTASSANRRD